MALVAGLIGLGGAEFRLPLLIVVFELYPHRAIRINLLISLTTLAVSAATRIGVLGTTTVSSHAWEVVAMTCGGVVAGWLGAGVVSRIPRHRLIAAISVLLLAVAVLLVLETMLTEHTLVTWPDDKIIRVPAALVGGLLVGSVSSLLGVAGGEFIIPMLVFLFGLDIRAAGTASALISVPIVVAGVARHWLAGRFRSRSLWAYLVLPMSFGSAVGAIAGSYAAAWVATLPDPHRRRQPLFRQNNFTCMPDNPKSPGNDPFCDIFDDRLGDSALPLFQETRLALGLRNGPRMTRHKQGEADGQKSPTHSYAAAAELDIGTGKPIVCTRLPSGYCRGRSGAGAGRGLFL